MAAGTRRNITIRIAQSQPSKYQPNNDTQTLSSAGKLSLLYIFNVCPNMQFMLGLVCALGSIHFPHCRLSLPKCPCEMNAGHSMSNHQVISTDLLRFF